MAWLDKNPKGPDISTGKELADRVEKERKAIAERQKAEDARIAREKNKSN